VKRRHSNYFLTDNLERAVDGAYEWFLANGCKWEAMKERVGNKHYRLPTRNEIKFSYLSIKLTAEKYSAKSCEAGDLCVKLAPLQYGYRRTKRTGEGLTHERAGHTGRVAAGVAQEGK
jgi:hypothetical protein